MTTRSINEKLENWATFSPRMVIKELLYKWVQILLLTLLFLTILLPPGHNSTTFHVLNLSISITDDAPRVSWTKVTKYISNIFLQWLYRTGYASWISSREICVVAISKDDPGATSSCKLCINSKASSDTLSNSLGHSGQAQLLGP